jgi:GWxTD domain-containing protein
VEINYGLLPGTRKNRAPNAFVLEMDVTQDDSLVLRNLWRVQPPAPTDSAGTNLMVVDALRFLLPPGRYNFKLLARPMSPKAQIDSAFVRSLAIRQFAPNQTALSDPLLAQKIEPAQSSGHFVKNGFRVVPNPLGVFEAGNGLFYYLEVYNLPQNNEKFYFLTREVLSAEGAPVPVLPVYRKKKIIRGRDDVEVGQMRIGDLRTGRYRLRFSVQDAHSRVWAHTEAAFVVKNPRLPASGLPGATQLRMENSVIATISPQNVNLFVEATRYFLPREEQHIVDRLSDETAKRRFLFQFWNGKGGRPGLEVFREFVKRVHDANVKFAETRKAGWQTDRGRIWILYGKPSEIQYYSNLPGFREFQAWSYDNIEHGVVFIFGVTGSFGDFKLLHSTKTGEIHNEAWLDRLKVTAGRTGLTEMAPGISQEEAIRAMFRRYNLEMPRFLLK